MAPKSTVTRLCARCWPKSIVFQSNVDLRNSCTGLLFKNNIFEKSENTHINSRQKIKIGPSLMFVINKDDEFMF